MTTSLNRAIILIFLILCLRPGCGARSPTIIGELKKWHKITLTFIGPQADEQDKFNPFLNYRLNVTFRNGNRIYVVPGYFAADGDAANTAATKGNKWRVHFSPDTVGTWTYSVSFRTGKNIAGSEIPQEGKSAGFIDGQSGSFEIGPTDKAGRDFRAKGRLEYVGEHYLKFSETGKYFLKCGADAPENLLAYVDFDGDFKSDGHKDKFIKDWSPHVKDWNEGDPTWQNGKGKGLIGAINYLASKVMNVFSFLTMNIQGDDQNVFPYTSYDERLRMDVSKLDQWEIIFEHADKLGLYLYFKTQEAENQRLLDEGELGVERKLYYRELIARFSHHLALNWNLGEENGSWGNFQGQTTAQRRAMAQYFFDHDPYKHHIVIHNGQMFDDLLGDQSKITGLSFQTNKPDFSRVHSSVLTWLEKTEESGKSWVIAVDEPGDAQHALVPDKDDPTHDDARKNGFWGALMAGAAGLEWYFGYKHDHSDLTCQDWRSRDTCWDQCRYALQYFTENDIPFWEMTNGDTLISTEGDYCFYKPGEVYVVYLKHGGESRLNLNDAPGTFDVRWYDPRSGHFVGEPRQVDGRKPVALVSPPADMLSDWVVLLNKK